MRQLAALDLFSGAGGFAIGLEKAGFQVSGVVENDIAALSTISANRPLWQRSSQPADIGGSDLPDIDLVTANIPSGPFSEAGLMRSGIGELPEIVSLIARLRPAAAVLLSVRGLATERFRPTLDFLVDSLMELGYFVDRKMIYGSHHGLLQLRPRLAIVALQPTRFAQFDWPTPVSPSRNVGEALGDLMNVNGWLGAEQWMERATGLAPTIVGGSTRHGGADLGPTRAKQSWLRLGVDPRGIADHAPDRTASPNLYPRLTNRMIARLQSFDDDWQFSGRKTSVYRQTANATPPIVAAALARSVFDALQSKPTA